ncbi:hypothetical protein B0T11DRAFT_290700 [Plectosphaerella cucumerina]|uniref:Uncharacterized protein n=1 Tax=Plectosphaerella cucumerina TaxID=40658 RepID=A0A8K0T8Y8_9PEZI|nr:hypothetical protein B0T11DRAFT_290700 [Plectosphaerella cucumerina]
MRTSVSCLVLAMAAHSAAYPLVPGLHNRDDSESSPSGKPRYPIVNVDGPDGDSDSPPTVTVTRHSAPTTVTHRVTDTVVYTTHKPTTIISIVPVDGKPDHKTEDEDKNNQPTAVTVTIWESSAAATSLPGGPSTTTTTVLVTPTPTTRPAVVDPEPEPTTDFVVPPVYTSSQSSSETSAELSPISSSVAESEAGSLSSPPPVPTTSTVQDDAESSTLAPQSTASTEPTESSAPTVVLEPTTVLESSIEVPTTSLVPAPSSSTPAAWDEVVSQSVSTEASSVASVVASPTAIALWPPAPGSPDLPTSSVPFLSAPSAPTTIIFVPSSLAPIPTPEVTAVQSHDDGYWYSSKYPSWNSTAPFV